IGFFEGGESSGATAPAAEELLKEIAEPSAIKAKLKSFLRTACAERPALPSRRRLEPALAVPNGAGPVALLPFLGVAQNLVGLVDLFELLFRLPLVLGNVGMIFTSQGAEGFSNLLFAGGLGDAQRLIIIFKLHCHGCYFFRFSRFVNPAYPALK